MKKLKSILLSTKNYSDLSIFELIVLKVSLFRNIFLVSLISSKNEQKQVDLRFHSSKVEFICSFLGGNVGLKKIVSTLSDL